jgi:hypothetical protein
MPEEEMVKRLTVLSLVLPNNKMDENSYEAYYKLLGRVPAGLMEATLNALAVTVKFYPVPAEILHKAAKIKLAHPSENDTLAAAHIGIKRGDWSGLHPAVRRALKAVGGAQAAEGLGSSEMNTWRAQFSKAIEREFKDEIEQEVYRLAYGIGGDADA